MPRQRESLCFFGWLGAVFVLLPAAWFGIEPTYGPWCWLLLMFFLVDWVGKIIFIALVGYVLYAAMPAHAEIRSGWGAFDSSRNEIYMGKLFDSSFDCKVNLDRHFPRYGRWDCRWIEMIAPEQLLIPPANARDGVRCTKNGGTTVCR